MRFDAEPTGRRQGDKLFRLHVAELVNPVVELGLLFGSEFEKSAVGAGFHKVTGK